MWSRIFSSLFTPEDVVHSEFAFCDDVREATHVTFEDWEKLFCYCFERIPGSDIVYE